MKVSTSSQFLQLTISLGVSSIDDTPPSANLRKRYVESASGTQIGGASILRELSQLAENCVAGNDPARDAVAFTLSTILGLHADDRDERAVTGDDTYILMSAGADCFTAAINFIGSGGAAEDALKIISELAQVTPKRLYGH
jgi:hypothetical protein